MFWFGQDKNQCLIKAQRDSLWLMTICSVTVKVSATLKKWYLKSSACKVRFCSSLGSHTSHMSEFGPLLQPQCCLCYHCHLGVPPQAQCQPQSPLMPCTLLALPVPNDLQLLVLPIANKMPCERQFLATSGLLLFPILHTCAAFL